MRVFLTGDFYYSVYRLFVADGIDTIYVDEFNTIDIPNITKVSDFRNVGGEDIVFDLSTSFISPYWKFNFKFNHFIGHNPESIKIEWDKRELKRVLAEAKYNLVPHKFYRSTDKIGDFKNKVILKVNKWSFGNEDYPEIFNIIGYSDEVREVVNYMKRFYKRKFEFVLEKYLENDINFSLASFFDGDRFLETGFLVYRNRKIFNGDYGFTIPDNMFNFIMVLPISHPIMSFLLQIQDKLREIKYRGFVMMDFLYEYIENKVYANSIHLGFNDVCVPILRFIQKEGGLKNLLKRLTGDSSKTISLPFYIILDLGFFANDYHDFLLWKHSRFVAQFIFPFIPIMLDKELYLSPNDSGIFFRSIRFHNDKIHSKTPEFFRIIHFSTKLSEAVRKIYETKKRIKVEWCWFRTDFHERIKDWLYKMVKSPYIEETYYSEVIS